MARKFVNAAALRNCQPILEVLLEELRPVPVTDPGGREPAAGREGAVLEISSGSGQHVVYIAPHFQQLTFVPSEVDEHNLKSIRAYVEESGLANVCQPEYVDASQPSNTWAKGMFPPGSLSAIININMMHITPFVCSQGLFQGAGELLAPSGRLLTYGPYAYNGTITPDSNVQFDKSLQNRDSSWGLRDVHRDLEPLAQKAGLSLLRIHRLPANNQLLVWEKTASRIPYEMFKFENKEYVNAAALRSCQPILEVLLLKLRAVPVTNEAGRKLAGDREGAVLEISSGAGLHVTHFAPHFPHLTFQPSEFDEEYLKHMRDNVEKAYLPNINPPIFLDASKPSSWGNGNFLPGSFSAIININMVHVSPFECAQGLFKGAGDYLAPLGRLFTYGAYKYNGVITPESNVEFDKTLRSRNSALGLRDVHTELKPLAKQVGLTLLEIHKLPANNQLLVWEKTASLDKQE